MKIIYSDKHKLRTSKTELYGGKLLKPFECPERMDYILQEIQKHKFLKILPPQNVNLKQLYKIHDKNYISFLENAWNEWRSEDFEGEAIPTVWPSRSMPSNKIPDFIEGKLGYYCLASETSISEGSYEAAIEAVKVAISASNIVINNEKNAFALCRPPGHHASFDQYGGYCFFNNAAIAAQNFLDNGFKRIFILDIDFHHGNGTQSIFYNRSDVFFASIHGDPLNAFPHFLGHKNEIGEGIGKGYNINYPLPPNTKFEIWNNALEQSFSEIKKYNPEILIISLGVDTFKNDPISFFKLNTNDFIKIGHKISLLNLPTLFIMEGGYAIKEIGINTVNTLKGFLDE